MHKIKINKLFYLEIYVRKIVYKINKITNKDANRL